MLFIWFILGTILGSFVLLVIERFHIDQFKTSLSGRSRCDFCHHKLNMQDLIPILSFLLTMGRCRYCRKELSIKYPLAEICMGIIALAVFYYSQTLALAFVNLFVIAILIIIAGIDFKSKTVVEILVLIAGLGAIVRALIIGDLNSTILGFLAGAGFFALMVVASKEKWMGSGDIEIGGVLGIFLGYPNIILSLIIAFVTGAIYGIMLIKKENANLKSQVPFVPFLVLGAIVSLYWGQNIINWYLGG